MNGNQLSSYGSRSMGSTNKFEPYFGTFSIVALDPDSGEIGVAVASRYFDVGYSLAWLKAGKGAVATQAYVNSELGKKGLDALNEGMNASEALTAILAEDEDSEIRQVGIVDFAGISASHTGINTFPWSGHLTAQNIAIQGNILTGPSVLQSMMDIFLETKGPLAEKLLSALEAGESQGGDKRGKQSAALFVVRKNGGFQGVDDRLVDLKISDHPDPIVELRRLFNIWRYIYLVPAYSRLADEEPEMSTALYGHIRTFLNKVLEEDIDDPEIFNSLAWFLAINKKFPEEAIIAAEKAYSLAPDNPNVIDTLAEAHYAADNAEKAVYWAKETLKLSPDNKLFKEQLERFSKSD